MPRLTTPMRHALELAGKQDYIVDRDTECWIWTRVFDPQGRPRLGGALAYRRMYEHAIGVIPHGHDLHHRCNDKRCVNPAHLVPVERVEHRRAHRCAMSVLTAETVVRMREEAFAGVAVAHLGERYGVSTSQALDIVTGGSWPDAGGPIGRPPRNCAWCDGIFTGHRNRRYCSTSCYRSAGRDRQKAAV